MSSDSYPATLGRGPPSRVDDAHRLEAVPAVAAGTRFTADAREEMSRLFHVHVVELAAEWIDLPAIRRRIEHVALVEEAAAALLDVRHVEAPIVLAWVSGGEVVGVLGASRMHRADPPLAQQPLGELHRRPVPPVVRGEHPESARVAGAQQILQAL